MARILPSAFNVHWKSCQESIRPFIKGPMRNLQWNVSKCKKKTVGWENLNKICCQEVFKNIYRSTGRACPKNVVFFYKILNISSGLPKAPTRIRGVIKCMDSTYASCIEFSKKTFLSFLITRWQLFEKFVSIFTSNHWKCC